MNFSASDLVKRSASQITFLYLKSINRPATEAQIRGNDYGEKLTKELGGSYEKRGVIKVDDNLLFFCIDFVKPPIFAEIKMVVGEYESWYLESSILQSVFYASLLEKVSVLSTPTFRMREGYKQEIITVPPNWEYQLWFGEDRYRTPPNSSVYNHYIEKLKIIDLCIKDQSYDLARYFDAVHKFREFKHLKPKYDKISI